MAPERGESKDRQRLDDGPVNAGVLTGSGGGGEGRGSGVEGAAPSFAVFGVEEEEESNGEHGSENPHDDGNARPKRGKIGRW